VEETFIGICELNNHGLLHLIKSVKKFKIDEIQNNNIQATALFADGR
jgi:hypothetical protein